MPAYYYGWDVFTAGFAKRVGASEYVDGSSEVQRVADVEVFRQGRQAS